MVSKKKFFERNRLFVCACMGAHLCLHSVFSVFVLCYSIKMNQNELDSRQLYSKLTHTYPLNAVALPKLKYQDNAKTLNLPLIETHFT